ncbi:GPI-anchored surface protein, putative [Bodo saltans]|uniref:GPI-anchored surface protein, putative n=1 Tax=Bodo saltans TaxID=75058 RepID=A0A0S4J134_BODSA|nr:GPI-anchored surface protein, putative [Bodo saltans]|eukprot:CUG51939.1 GPI-anchored surface protein, putative [Bodo saltans]
MSAKAIVLVALLAAWCSAVPVDPIAWTAALTGNNASTTAAQWIATSSSGAVVVVNGTDFVGLDASNGWALWTATHKDIDATSAIFAASSTTLAVVVGTKVLGFNLTNGQHFGTVDISSNAVTGAITSIVVTQDLFIVAGQDNFALIAGDLTVRYETPKTKNTAITGVSTAGNYVYYTTLFTAPTPSPAPGSGSSSFQSDSSSGFGNVASSSSSSGSTATLVIVDLSSFSEVRVDNVAQVSTTAAGGNILAVQASSPAVGSISLATGKYVWINTDVANSLLGNSPFILLPTSDIAVIVAGATAFALDSLAGSQLFQYNSSFTITQPTIAAGRLVFVGEQQQGLSPLVFVDLSSGSITQQIVTPVLSTPVVIFSGVNALILNGQGYTRVNLVSQTAVSYNLNIPGADAVAAVQTSSSSTTFIFASAVATAVVISN